MTARSDILHAATSDARLPSLHEKARSVRDDIFGRRVFVRGVVEVSSYCRQSCLYCAMRRYNHALERYRLAADELAEMIIHHRPAAITDIEIQAGEDPVALSEVVLPLINELRRHTNLGITLCLGTLAPYENDRLRKAGGDHYVIKIETGNASHYQLIGAPGTLDERVTAICYLAGTGWNVSSGFIAGLPGQTPAHVKETMDLLAKLPLAGCSVSPFVAGEQTPFKGAADGDIELALDCVAQMRLAVPHWIIPAVSAMQLVSEDGYVRAFNAGANLATINLTPHAARANYPIYKHDRFIMDEDRVRSAIAEAGCEISPVGIAEHLKNQLASEGVLGSTGTASRILEVARNRNSLNCQSSPVVPSFSGSQGDNNSSEFTT